ncbi:MAG: hypothetical protein HN590_16100 [Calditrichaeota bacterium]|nr:hypothetical protein [Calditrichota bacterium]
MDSKFADWIKNYIRDFGFKENHDYWMISKNLENKKRGRRIEYSLVMDMAKELSMLQRSDKGKLARQYFIDCEKQLRAIANRFNDQLPKDFGEALILAGQMQKQLTEQTRLNQEQVEVINSQGKIIDQKNTSIIRISSKAKAYERIHEKLKGSELIRDFIRRITVPENPINNIYKVLRKHNILMSGPRHNQPRKQYIDRGYLKIKTQTYLVKDQLMESYSPLVTEKGKTWLVKQLIRFGYIEVEEVKDKLTTLAAGGGCM